MRLAPAQPLMLTKRGCPLAFDLIDADNPQAGIIGRATYERWATAQGVILYTVKVQRGDSCLIGTLPIRALAKF